ncbi:MAG TPA: hypothetical protein VMV10_14490 [Pirellulales bacterium]|nr:hypothetical protein [Pirellulales bacterium]
MPIPLDAPEVLNREFLEVRAKILEIAAALDRLDRAAGSVEGDQRLARIRQGLAMLTADRSDRAEQVQLIFSLAYEEGWRKQFQLDERME